MRSPDSSPSSAKARASAFVRRSSSAHVTCPSESITATWSGRVIAFTTQAVAGVVPHRWNARPARTSRSGRTGRSMPRRASTATDSACVCRGSRTARTILVGRGPAASRAMVRYGEIGDWHLGFRNARAGERACRIGGGRAARLRRRRQRRRRPATAPAGQRRLPTSVEPELPGRDREAPPGPGGGAQRQPAGARARIGSALPCSTAATVRSAISTLPCTSQAASTRRHTARSRPTTGGSRSTRSFRAATALRTRTRRGRCTWRRSSSCVPGRTWCRRSRS